MGSEELKEGTHEDGAEQEDDKDEEKGEEEEEKDEDKNDEEEEGNEEEDEDEDDDDEDNKDVGNVEEVVSEDDGKDDDSTASAEADPDSTDDITEDQVKQGAYDNFKNINDDPLTREHMHAFMHLAYKYNKNGELKEHNKSKKFTEKCYKKMILIIDKWNKEKKKVTVGSKKMKMSEFKNKHRIGYNAIKHYDLEVLKLTDGMNLRQLHRLEEGQKARGIVVPMNRVFDAIKSAHG